MHHELLTFHQCAKYQPDIKAYKNMKYLFCHIQTETMIHFITCDKNLNLSEMKSLIIKKFSNKLKKRNILTVKLVEATIILTEIMTDAYLLWRLVVGLFSENLWNVIRQSKSNLEMKPLAISMNKYIRLLIQSYIWHPPNKIAIHLKKSINITFLIKHPPKHKLSRQHTKSTVKLKAIDPEDISPDLAQHIESWIWKGIKFLGQ